MPVCSGIKYQKCKKEISKNDYMKNLPEFKALIERYESITLEDIESNYFIIFDAITIANKLTGYGKTPTCTLCQAAKNEWDMVDCSLCVYGDKVGCTLAENKKTYYAISEAESPKQLLKAFKARARHMRKILKAKGL